MAQAVNNPTDDGFHQVGPMVVVAPANSGEVIF